MGKMSRAVFLLVMGFFLENNRAHDIYKPDIMLEPYSGEAIIGDEVNITCMAPFSYPGSTFLLHKIGDAPATQQQKAPDGYYLAIFSFTRIQQSDEGTYACQYISEDGVPFNSSWSDTETIIVKPLEKPTTSLVPASGEATQGTNVTITCVDRTKRPGIRFSLLRVRSAKLIREKAAKPGTHAVNFYLTDVQDNDEDVYQCRYRMEGANGIWSESPPSDPIRVTVIEHVPKPKITFDPVSGTALQGGVIIVRCEFETEGRKTVYLYRAREMISNVTFESTGPFLFTIANVNSESGGFYRCIYDKYSSRKTRSVPSDPIRLTILDAKAPVSTLRPASAAIIEGGNLSMTCASATSHKCFFYDDQYIDLPLAEGRSNVPISITDISFCDSGNYTCQCLLEVNGIQVYSARSNLMPVTVIADVSGFSIFMAISLSCAAFILVILISAILGVCLSKKRPAMQQPASSSVTELVIVS